MTYTFVVVMHKYVRIRSNELNLVMHKYVRLNWGTLLCSMTKSKNGKISEANHYFLCPAIEPWEEIVFVARPSCRGFSCRFWKPHRTGEVLPKF
jgi:hypothetical protein